MPSERQLEANRRNGSKGGPKTEAGKQRSRRNSLKHGLTSSTLVVLPEEHEHEYEEILRGFRESFQPHNAAEDALVLRLAHAHWRSLRSRRVETGILKVTAAVERSRTRECVENCPENLNPHEAIGVAFMTMPPEHWQMYMRYDAAISRDFFRTLDTLTRLQRARQREKPAKPLVLAAGAAVELSDPGIRSVSQSSVVRAVVAAILICVLSAIFSPRVAQAFSLRRASSPPLLSPSTALSNKLDASTLTSKLSTQDRCRLTQSTSDSGPRTQP